ncbi:MAG: redoxin domain-containing protein [Sulfurimonas sp.]|nr:redoxin domain-containing protein [Sulfurimonas sp.]
MKKIKHYFKEIIFFFILITIFANALSAYRSIDLNKSSLNIESATLLSNIKYAMPKDKIIMVYFWATWCPSCKLQASNIQKISKNYEVLTIAYNSGSDKQIKQYLKENQLSYNVINDSDGYITNKFDVTVFPTTIIYDKNKNIVFRDVGYTSTLGLYLRMWWANF